MPRAPLTPEQQRLRSAWRQELLKLLLLSGLGSLVGALFSGAVWGLIVVLTMYLAIQYRHLAALLIWLRSPKRHELPEPGGLWGEAFDRLADMHRRNRKKKKRLAAMLSEFQASTAALPDGAVVLSERGARGGSQCAHRPGLASGNSEGRQHPGPPGRHRCGLPARNRLQTARGYYDLPGCGYLGDQRSVSVAGGSDCDR